MEAKIERFDFVEAKIESLDLGFHGSESAAGEQRIQLL
jgi:hypothetical protein